MRGRKRRRRCHERGGVRRERQVCVGMRGGLDELSVHGLFFDRLIAAESVHFEAFLFGFERTGGLAERHISRARIQRLA